MKKYYITTIISIVLAGFLTQPVYAVLPQEAGSTASILVGDKSTNLQDTRVETLQAYLAAHHSPLTEYASYFISEADRLSLDWKLVAAIAGTESTFGKFIPKDSFNAWGWGIFTGKSDGIHFTSWADGIRTVSEGLKYRYVDKGAITVEQMGKIYAASPVWASHVRYFMEKIETFSPSNVQSVDDLEITL